MLFKYMWIARDKDNTLHLYQNKPYKDEKELDTFRWKPCIRLNLNQKLFPELTWESEPLELECEYNEIDNTYYFKINQSINFIKCVFTVTKEGKVNYGNEN